MKKPLLTLALTAIQLAAFAQGIVTFGNDANHLIVVDTNTYILEAVGKNPALAGLPAPQIGTANDVMSFLTAQLFAGTTPDSLTLQSTLNPAGLAGLADGRLLNATVTLTGIGTGVNAYFQIKVWETRAGSFENAQGSGSGWWIASTPVFSGVTGTFAPTPLTFYSNWSPGPILLTGNIPEPSTYALLVLGLGSLWFIRRRK